MKEEEIHNAFTLTRELPPEVSFEQVTSVVEQAAAGALTAKAAGSKVAAKNLLNIKFLSAMTGFLALAFSLFFITGNDEPAQKAAAAVDAAEAAAPDTIIPADTAKKRKTAPAPPSITRTRKSTTTTTTTTRNSDGTSTTVSVTSSDSTEEVETGDHLNYTVHTNTNDNANTNNYTHTYSRGRSYGVGSSEKRHRTYVYTTNEEEDDGEDESHHENVTIEVDAEEDENDYAEASCESRTACTMPGAFEKEMLKDGLIKDTVEYCFSLTRRHFTVNGKKQPEEVFKKYVKIFEEATGSKIFALTTYSYCIDRRDSE